MKQTLQNLTDNWKTTFAGITAIVGSTVHIVFSIRHGTADEGTWTTAILGVATGIGLMFAGDASKSKADVAKVDAKVDQTATAITNGDTAMLPKPTETTKV